MHRLGCCGGSKYLDRYHSLVLLSEPKLMLNAHIPRNVGNKRRMRWNQRQESDLHLTISVSVHRASCISIVLFDGHVLKGVITMIIVIKVQRFLSSRQLVRANAYR